MNKPAAALAEYVARRNAETLSASMGTDWFVYSLVDFPETFVFSEVHPYQLPGHGRRWVATYRNGTTIDDITERN